MRNPEDTKYVWDFSHWLKYSKVQQFTGLKDSKGNEVWEGDIIKYTRLIEKERRIVELFSFIKFQDAKFGFDLTGFNDTFYDLSDEPDFEVIGNIFENSELLKQ